MEFVLEFCFNSKIFELEENHRKNSVDIIEIFSNTKFHQNMSVRTIDR